MSGQTSPSVVYWYGTVCCSATCWLTLVLHSHVSLNLFNLILLLCFQNQLSGNLLRKFKNSNGWQKLWVVFTNFSLFFYKSHQVRCTRKTAVMIDVVVEAWSLRFFSCPQDDYPLASLPLLGYSVTVPLESENIHKDYVFKLHFKSHVYYFRSESEYTFERWESELII